MCIRDRVYTVGRQITETIRRHEPVSEADARGRALKLFERVRIPSPERRLDAYPHEMSGGMRQRAMIALALACNPKILLADEPTTALDATVQVQILLLLRELQRELGLSMIFVTHDIGVAVEVADRVAVMYAGRIVELGPVRMAEIQEELLWISEAAHVPVIWATQVLENLAKKGLPSRAELTDAAMSERAECVMLNKGPYILETVRVLNEVLTRMAGHQRKKMPTFRPLRSWEHLLHS